MLISHPYMILTARPPHIPTLYRQQGAYSAQQAGKSTTLGGISALWAGSVPALTGAVLENAAAFGINGILTRMDLFGHNSGTPSSYAATKSETESQVPVYESFVTGSITGFLTAFVLCPCDVIKCRSQIALVKNMPSDTMSVLRHTLATTGGRGLFVGMGAQVSEALNVRRAARTDGRPGRAERH